MYNSEKPSVRKLYVSRYANTSHFNYTLPNQINTVDLYKYSDSNVLRIYSCRPEGNCIGTFIYMVLFFLLYIIIVGLKQFRANLQYMGGVCRGGP